MPALLPKPARELWDYRELLWRLTRRDLAIRYKQTVLGVAWALFTPVAMMLIFTFVFTRVAPVASDGIPYPVFAYAGLLPWTFFATSLTSATTSLTGNFALVTKVYFPREVFPLAAVGSKLVDFLLGTTLFAALLAWYGIPLRWTALLVPAVLVVQIVFTVALAFLLAMGNLFYRDVRYIFEPVIVVWMFVTSVVYPLKVASPSLQFLLNLNPMTPIIDAYRALLLKGAFPEFGSLGMAAVLALSLLAVAWTWFDRAEFLFAERI